jgi:hypothetical protein
VDRTGDGRATNGRGKVPMVDEWSQDGTGEIILRQLGDPTTVAMYVARVLQKAREFGARDDPRWYLVRPSYVRWLRRMNYLDPETGQHEPDERIIELVRRYRAGATVRKLAEMAGVSKSTMGRIMEGTGRLPFDAADLDELQTAA